ncbi:substrate-binding domain-containing protein [Paenibacillus elgii]|uniref:substrate-binding domain-containing protein n=1 Tax=Paenibacillus elgii TaxID=189691 RepID=UPI000248C355|nr:substrate-binding domain-containing protein [Paenibacillus elgii]
MTIGSAAIRTIPVLLAALLCLLLLTSCGSENTEPHIAEPKKQIALVLKTDNSDYWKTVRTGAEAAAKEFGVELSVGAPKREEDVQGQIQLVNEAVNYKRDALVLAANDDQALAEAAGQAAERGMPVIAIDTEIDSPRVRSFIGIDNFEAGRKAGLKMASLVGNRGRIAVIGFKPSVRTTEQRERGVLDELAKHSQMKVVEQVECASDPAPCARQIRRLLQEPVDGVVALHAISSIEVVRAIGELGLEGKVKAVTFDSTAENIESLQEGVIQATIIQNPFSMGYLGVKYAVEALEGKKVPARFDTGTKVIDQDNMFWSDNQKLLFPFVK